MLTGKIAYAFYLSQLMNGLMIIMMSREILIHFTGLSLCISCISALYYAMYSHKTVSTFNHKTPHYHLDNIFPKIRTKVQNFEKISLCSASTSVF